MLRLRCPRLRGSRPSSKQLRALRASATAIAVLVLGARARAQQPLFTIAHTSDSQAATEAEWQRFETVLRTIADAGKPGALIPRPIDLVLFPGDITASNTNAQWVRSMGLFATYLTANNIPLLAAPGNRDQGASANQTQLYQQFVGSAGVWDWGSAAFTGQNGISRNTGWTGLRFIGFNNSNGAWNKISDADLALIGSRVTTAAAAQENVLLVGHHDHNGQGRIPLATTLRNTAVVGYVRGHVGTPHVTKGLAGVTNPNVWDLSTNAIVNDTDLVYYEVFPTQIKAYLIVLDNHPTSLPAPSTIALPFPLRSTQAQNLGFQGASHASARAWPSGYAPEKKLWFQGGNWFGVLWHEASLSWHVFRLDTIAQSWVDTGTSVSSGADRSFDALADAGTGKLYLASHVYSVPAAPGAGSGGQVLRYSYNAATRSYTLDAGFPVTVNDARSESLTLAKDTTGTLWAAWTLDGDVRTAHTVNGIDTTWSTAAILPFPDASGLDPADTAAVVAFDGKVAVLWTDRIGGAIGCALRADTAAQTTWVLEDALTSPGSVGDALDVATSGGRLFVATSTPAGAVRLLRREVGLPGSGSWSLVTVADSATGLSQPIVQVDETQQLVRVFATGASASGGSALGGGVIYEKDASLTTLAFAAGKGTAVLQDGQNFAMARATSTHQALSSFTQLVVSASNELSQRSWHEFTSLGTPPVVPVADFSGSPRSGTAPLVVHFSDLSSGAPTSFLWNFGDGTTSSLARPDHAYAQPGAYAVSLQVSNAAGSNTLARSGYVSVSAPIPTVTRGPIADALVSEASKATNFGTGDVLRVRSQNNGSYRSLLRFDTSGVGTIVSAKLRLWVTDDSTNGGNLYRLSNATWVETTVNWNNKPALPPSSFASLGSTTLNTWEEIDVTSALGGNGIVDFALSGGGSNLAGYASREAVAANRPQLVLGVLVATQPPVADFSGTPLSGEAPLTVQFSDASSGSPTGWQWSFGDATSAAQQSPEHVYAQPGTYTVALTASNGAGSNARTRSAYVTVLPASTAVQTFHPLADARVSESSASSNFGLDPELRSKTQAGSSFQSFLKFDLATLAGRPTSAKLRLFVTDESNSGGSIYPVSSAWTETALTWSNRPTLPATPLATAGAAPLGTWIEFDVSAAVLGPGIVSFGLNAATTNSILYSSREGAHPPELVVETRNARSPAVAQNPTIREH